MIDETAERVKFDAHYGALGVDLRCDSRGRYVLEWVEDMWDGWLAAKRDAAADRNTAIDQARQAMEAK